MKTLVFLAVLVLCNGALLPSDFPKCKLRDPNLNLCLLKALNGSLPLLTRPYDRVRLPSLDPLFVPDVAKNGNVNFTEPFENGKIYGLTVARVTKFEFDFDKKTIVLEALFPKVRVTGQHNFNNKVLVLPFIGAGTGKTTLKNLEISANFLFDEIQKDGKSYITVVAGTLQMQPSLANFTFENLRDTDQAFTDQINTLLKANWRGVYNEFESDYTENFLKLFQALFNNFFSEVSIQEAFDLS